MHDFVTGSFSGGVSDGLINISHTKKEITNNDFINFRLKVNCDNAADSFKFNCKNNFLWINW